MHFSLAVLHYADQNLDSILEPFDELMEVERHITYSRQEAIDYARTHFASCKNASDAYCWEALAEDADETDAEGNLYSTCNPDGKWDWWTTGGRWNGLLKVGDKRLNSAFVKDIDFDSAPFTTFAVLTPDGEWHEQESWQKRDSEKAMMEWNRRYKERFIDISDPNLMITIVDCHS